MSEQPEGQFRGRIPGTGQPGSTGDRAASGGPAEWWGWPGVTDARQRLPWFGLFLVLFGSLLLLEQLVPGSRALGSGFVVAVGVALLISWFVNRRPWALYAGTILTA